MAQEPSSTVKHINWIWPDCLVGNGDPYWTDSSRGAYNVGANHVVESKVAEMIFRYRYGKTFA
jgi:hypothetical protein